MANAAAHPENGNDVDPQLLSHTPSSSSTTTTTTTTETGANGLNGLASKLQNLAIESLKGDNKRQLNPNHSSNDSNSSSRNHDGQGEEEEEGESITVPETLISPRFTPPTTPGGSTDLANLDAPARIARGSIHHPPVNLHPPPPPAAAAPQQPTSAITPSPSPHPQRELLPKLPHVECVVRARIPTTAGAEMFLHLYHNDLDNKEHLAIVFGHEIRSRSLDRVRPGETEMDRMIRGAYVGRLRPGRTSSRFDEEEEEEGEGEERKREGGQEELEDQSQTIANGGRKKAQREAPLVRIHSECYTGETAWSARCDCGEQLDEAARLMSESVEAPPPASSSSSASVSSATSSSSLSSARSKCAGGVIVYLRQEGRGIGLGEKLKAYNLQDLGNDTVEANLLLRHPADGRSYGLATAILVDLGLGRDAASGPEGEVGGQYGGIRLLTNNPDKVRAVEGPGREVIVKERVPMVPIAWRTKGEKGIKSAEIEGYLRTKIGKMGHMIE